MKKLYNPTIEVYVKPLLTVIEMAPDQIIAESAEQIDDAGNFPDLPVMPDMGEVWQ